MVEKSPIKLPLGVASVLDKMGKGQSRSQAIAERIVKDQGPIASQIAAQIQGSLVAPQVQSAMDSLSKQLEETQRSLAQAAAFARANIDTWGAAQSEAVSRFSFPMLPALAFPQLDQIDWSALQKRFIKGVIHLADCGWTAPSWMIPGQVGKLGSSTDDDIDEYFARSYLGDDKNEGRMKRTFEALLKGEELETWRGLLNEVSECLQKGKYRVCVPALLTVLEGFTVESLCRQLKTSRRVTNKNILASLKKTKRHEGGNFTSLMWTSLVVFLDRLLASSDFERPRPSFINRHWILHGRSPTDWTAAEALKLLNALATVHWLFELSERHNERSRT